MLYNRRMNKDLLKELINLGKEQATTILKELESFYITNSQNLIKYLNEDNLIEAQKIKESGFSWSNSATWKGLFLVWANENSSPEKIKFIFQLVPDEIFSSNNSSTTTNNLSTALKEIKDFKTLFKTYLNINLDERFNSSYGNYKLSPYLAKWIYVNRQDSLKNNIKFLESYCSYLAQSDLSKMENLVEDITKNFSSSAHYLIDRCKSHENMNMLLDNKTYSRFLENSKPNYLETLMSNSISGNNIEVVRSLVGRGIDLPKDKKTYSALFSTANQRDTMNYIIDNIPDITVGSHVILKTALHYDNEIIAKILEKYTLETGISLPLLIKDRLENKGVKLVKNLILKNNLETALIKKNIIRNNKI